MSDKPSKKRAFLKDGFVHIEDEDGCIVREATESHKLLWADIERLRAALISAAHAMADCQHNAHKGKVCFDGDHWHETFEQVSKALWEPPKG